MLPRLLKMLRRRMAHRRRGNILRAFSLGRISKDQAMHGLGLRDYADLLIELGQANLPLPRLPDEEIERMKENFLCMWRDK